VREREEDEDGAAVLQEDDDAELSAVDDGHRRDRSEVPAEDSDGDGDSRSAWNEILCRWVLSGRQTFG